MEEGGLTEEAELEEAGEEHLLRRSRRKWRRTDGE